MCEARESEECGESYFTEDHNKCIVSLGTEAEGEGVAKAWAEEVT